MGFEIKVTSASSFCPGVDRAFRITERMLAGCRGPAYSAGPLIHNPGAVERLEALGLGVLDLESGELPDLRGVPVVVRSHGIDTATEEALLAGGASLVDATCPKVRRVQDEARGLAEKGLELLVLGKASHPEVKAIVSRSGAKATVLETPGDALRWARRKGSDVREAGLVCQTTISRDLLKSVVRTLDEELDRLEVRDTICEAVSERRRQALLLCGEVDLMLVVGGRNSSNTTRLAEACAELVPTRHLEDSSEMLAEWLRGVSAVGVTGGASTPDWQVEEVLKRLRALGGRLGEA